MTREKSRVSSKEPQKLIKFPDYLTMNREMICVSRYFSLGTAHHQERKESPEERLRHHSRRPPAGFTVEGPTRDRSSKKIKHKSQGEKEKPYS